MKNIWSSKNAKQFAKVLCQISDVKTMQNFLRDVMTEKEIIEISARFEAAKMLTNGEKYEKVVSTTKLSSRTVARISQWLKNGCKGYKEAINLVSKTHLAS
jgi:TrpR-related protein YerC/YecD